MRNKFSIGFLVLILVFVSCERKRESNMDIHFNLSHSIGDTVSISGWMIPLELVALETTDESLLGSIDKLIEFDGKFYILDKMRKSVLVFDAGGKYLHRIGKMGDGPGEYSALSDFTLDETTGNLYLLTNPSEIYAFDSNGSYLFKTKISNSMLWNIGYDKGNFICSSNHLTYTSGDDAFLFYSFDHSLDLLNKDVSVHSEQIYTPLLISSPFMKWRDGLYYFDNYFNTIYTFDNGDAFPVCKIDFDSPMPTEYFLDTSLFMSKQRNYDYVVDVSLSANSLLIAYIHSGKHYTALFDMATRRIVANGVTKGMLPPVYGNGDVLYSPISAEHYLSYWQHLNDYLKTSVSFDNNPLLLKWKLKERVLTQGN